MNLSKINFRVEIIPYKKGLLIKIRICLKRQSLPEPAPVYGFMQQLGFNAELVKLLRIEVKN